jgi:hypothetical protein
MKRATPPKFPVVRDDYQGRSGDGGPSYLTFLAKREGLYGFTAEVLVGEQADAHLFERWAFDTPEEKFAGVHELQMAFRGA